MEQKYHLGYHGKGFHRLAYTEWNENNHTRTVICAHGYTRNSRDFDELAKVLQKDFRVICPDTAGRGKSDWLPGPSFYTYQQNLSDINALIARLDVDEIYWVGSSLGGGFGYRLAALPNSPITKLILNDVGPVVESLKSVGTFTGRVRTFENLEEVQVYLSKVYAPMKPMTAHNWRHMAETSVILGDDGLYRLSYDPNFLLAPRVPSSDRTRWRIWNKVKCPVYLLHGTESDVLSPRIIDEMLRIKPSMKVAELPGVGHTPSLMDSHQISLVHNWLKEPV